MMKMKRRELAERADLSYPYVSEIEKGTKEPSAKSLRQLAEALGFGSTAELLAWTEQQHSLTEALADSDELASGTADLRPPIHLQPPALRGKASDLDVWPATRFDLPAADRFGLSRTAEDAIDAVVMRTIGQLREELRLELTGIVAAEVARQIEQERLRR